MNKKVIIIEDDTILLASLNQMIELAGLEPLPMTSLVQARRSIRANFAGVVLTDIKMPRQDGFDVLQYTKNVDPELPVVLLTGHSDVPTALRAMKNGAYDYLEKPCSTESLIEVLYRALEHRTLVLKSRRIEQALLRGDPASIQFPGSSVIIAAVRDTLRKVGASTTSAHIYGVSGVGKKLAAMAINQLSETRRPLVQINLTNAVESAVRDLNCPDQPADLLIRNLECATPLQQNELVKLVYRHPNLRLITSSVHSLENLRNNTLTEELQASESVIEIELPTLDQRREDLVEIFESMLLKIAQNLNTDSPELPGGLAGDIMSRTWPGNLPQLRAYATTFILSHKIDIEPNENPSLAEQLDNFERLILSETLQQCQGRAAQAAKILGLPRNTLYDRLTRHGLSPKNFQSHSPR